MDKKEKTVAEYLQQISDKVNRLEKLLLSQKTALTFDETADYTGLSKSFLYKLTMNRGIPHYKPRGKMINTCRQEIDEWMLQNRITPADEIEAKASTYGTLDKTSRK